MNRKDIPQNWPEGVMLNAYPDSCGGNLGALVEMLSREEFRGAFSSFYVLPSLFRSDLDRGFSVLSYDLDETMGSREDLEALRERGIVLKMDFVLNHLSVQSPFFQDLLEKGEESAYTDFFIDWNRFWEGLGEVGPGGYVLPREEYLSSLFMRKPGLPLLRVPFPDGTERFYWNTFYQKVTYRTPRAEELREAFGSRAEALQPFLRDLLAEGRPPAEADFGPFREDKPRILAFLDRRCASFLGQMDLNARSPQVWEFYRDTLEKLGRYGAKVVRLDAFAYLHKEAGRSNFFNEPGTWEYLERIKESADREGMVLLPEIHGKYEDRIHEKLADKGFPIYDFFFPGLVIDAVEGGRSAKLAGWIEEIRRKGFRTVNMLGCHDGIPLLDVKGLLEDREIDGMIALIKSRGGRVKDLFGPDGKRISYYQVNATFFSALGEDPRKMLLARALQMFMPGIPEVWYLDIFAGKNDYPAADREGHKEINRTNLSLEEIDEALTVPVVREQLRLLRFRNNCRAFGFESDLQVETPSESTLRLSWKRGRDEAVLSADLRTLDYEIFYREEEGGLRRF